MSGTIVEASSERLATASKQYKTFEAAESFKASNYSLAFVVEEEDPSSDGVGVMTS